MTEVERKTRRGRGKKREREIESERGAALAVHITLLTIRGQCHRVRPAAPLHFTWLHLAPPLRFSPACPPPPRFASLPPPRAPPHAFSHPKASLAPSSLSPRARAIASSPLPHDHPPVVMSLLSSSFYLRPLSLLLYRRLLSRVSTSPSSSSSSSLPSPPHPAPAPCSSSSAPTEHSHRPFVYEGTKRLSVSSRLVSLDSLSLLSLLRSWLLLLLPLPSFFLPALLPPPLLPSSPIRPSPSFPPLDSPTPSRCLAFCSCA